MKTIFPARNLSWFLFLSAMFALGACKKHSPKPISPGGDTTANSSRLSDEDSLKFYVWYYMESDSSNIPQYYWYNQVPSTFNWASSQFSTADSVLSGQTGLTSYPTYEGKKVDRYSFLDRTGAVAQEIEGGQSGDMGFDISWAADQNGNTTLWVIYSYANSPAGSAGVQRGWEITAVNGNTNVSYDGPGYGTGTDANVNMVLNAVYGSQSASFTFERPDGTDTTISISPETYNLNPVLFDTVYNVNGTNVGYMVFNSFVDVYTYDSLGNVNGGTPTKTALDNVFSKFESAGIKDLIIDERYNGGGAVSTAEYIDNYVAPASANGQTMYTYYFNTPLENYFQSQNYDFSTKFSKQGSLALNNVFFIVGNDTYSAAELTINNLIPYMNVQLIGDTTGGKPVGFIPQDIDIVNDTTNQEYLAATLYAINFQTKNSQGNGDYFFGIAPNKEEDDYVDLNWGSSQDPRLQDAFNYIKNGSYARTSEEARLVGSMPAARGYMNKKVMRNKFNGMIDYRLRMRGQNMFLRLKNK